MIRRLFCAGPRRLLRARARRGVSSSAASTNDSLKADSGSASGGVAAATTRNKWKKLFRPASLKGAVNLQGIRVNGATKRFYKDVSIEERDGGWAVLLDNRPLVTQEKRLVIVPSASCASALAYEWYSQGDRIKPYVMPLMSLAVTAIDVNPENIISKLSDYIELDSMLYRADFPPALAKMQRKYWDPVVNYFRDEYGMTIHTTEAIFKVDLPEETVDRIKGLMYEADQWELSCIKAVAEVGHSCMLGIAVSHGKLTLKNAYNASMAERLFQIRRYGEVKGPYGHGTELEYPRMHIAAAITFMDTVREDRCPFAPIRIAGDEASTTT